MWSVGNYIWDPDNEGRNILIIKVDEEIGRYYRFLFQKQTYNCIPINCRRLGCHITVILDEKITNLELIQSLQGKEVKFWFPQNKWAVNKYLLVNVECPEAHYLRTLCGLSYRLSKFRLHLTIGDFKCQKEKVADKEQKASIKV